MARKKQNVKTYRSSPLTDDLVEKLKKKLSKDRSKVVREGIQLLAKRHKV